MLLLHVARVCASASVELVRRASERHHDAAGGGYPEPALPMSTLRRLVAELAVKVGLVHSEAMGELGPGELWITVKLAVEECTYSLCRDGVELELLELLAIALVRNQHPHPSDGQPDAPGRVPVGEPIDVHQSPDTEPALRA